MLAQIPAFPKNAAMCPVHPQMPVIWQGVADGLPLCKAEANKVRRQSQNCILVTAEINDTFPRAWNAEYRARNLGCA